MSRTKKNEPRNFDLKAILVPRLENLSQSERALATHMLTNEHLLPFETGASLAQTTGVSEMTVSRFVRSLGFAGLRDLKDRLRGSVQTDPGAVDDIHDRFRVRGGEPESLKGSLELELDAVRKAYALAGSELWAEAVDEIARRETIFVVGFQASQGLALDFASRLLYARPNVFHIDDNTGTYTEILTADPKKSLLVHVDTAAYATRGVKLLDRVKQTGLPTVIVTDRFSHWAAGYTKYVFEGHTHVQTFFDSTAALSVLLNLLTNAVATRLGAKAKKRFEVMRDLGRHFDEFVRVPRPKK
ncbi:MAG: MurR/RpiR family transcriptional regulator [Pseudomonadota bacterium]